MKDKNTLGFWIALGVGAAMAVLIALMRGLIHAENASQAAGLLSDGFFVAGVMLAGAGGLIAISGKTDFFDMLSYGFKSLGVMFTPFRKPEKHPRYYEYKQQRKEKRKPPKMFPLYAGLILIAIAAVCLVFNGG